MLPHRLCPCGFIFDFSCTQWSSSNAHRCTFLSVTGSRPQKAGEATSVFAAASTASAVASAEALLLRTPANQIERKPSQTPTENAIQDEWSFLPGKEHCGGGNFRSTGRQRLQNRHSAPEVDVSVEYIELAAKPSKRNQSGNANELPKPAECL
jgi:hypothetical protein